MSRRLKYGLCTAAAGILVVLIAIAYSLSSRDACETVCRGVKVTIKDSADCSFIREDEALKVIAAEYGDVKGKKTGEIDISGIERIMDSKSAVRKSEAYMTRDGILHLRIEQFRPVLRFQNGSTGFYVDSEGTIFPLQKNWTANVRVIEGDIPVLVKEGYKGAAQTQEQREWIGKVLRLCEKINSDNSWKKTIGDISVRKNGDLVLKPISGKEKFIFGPPDEIEDKFAKIERYYSCIVPAKGAGCYSSVNLKFDGQIVCRK